MSRRLAGLVIAAMTIASFTAPVRAADDSLVKLTLDGRPVDRSSGSAVLHDGIVYGDVEDLVRSFDGILTFQRDTITVTINSVTAKFTQGSSTVTLGAASVVMPGPVITRDGENFVPLEFFITRVCAAKLRISPDKTSANIYVNSNPLS
jgi:archaellum component FlaF (FlaF/FlaG flagellin family)